MFNFIHGDPLMVDYTPSGASVSAGDLVVAYGRACIAHNDIADGELGAVAWPCGRAVYEIEGDLTFADTDSDDLSAGGRLGYSSGEYTNAPGAANEFVGRVMAAVVAGATDGVYLIHSVK